MILMINKDFHLNHYHNYNNSDERARICLTDNLGEREGITVVLHNLQHIYQLLYYINISGNKYNTRFNQP